MRRPAPASLRKRNPVTVARARRPAAAGRPAPSRRRGYDASPAIATAPACPKAATQQFQPFRPLGAYVNGRAFLHCDQGGGAVPRCGRENCQCRRKKARPGRGKRAGRRCETDRTSERELPAVDRSHAASGGSLSIAIGTVVWMASVVGFSLERSFRRSGSIAGVERSAETPLHPRAPVPRRSHPVCRRRPLPRAARPLDR